MNEILTEINKLKELNTLIIVEGKKDITALHSLGLKNIIEINNHLYLFSEKIAKTNREVVILTDLDAEGKRIYSKLNKNLSQMGIKINNKLRNLLFRTKLRQIEGLANYIERNNFI